ncbi:cytokine receptor common subunit beta isoform X2 [Parambassis ranga]|uniref:Cytokine receptor common subunit beta isoform X2 n=1 Tax=Parambassis ranga TaxID=210632 RepID=A0A6P7IPT5_9TELE|nr:interleukin-4 receptor subunit alpha isoform X2 [Parambassis ranga]
MRLLWVLLWLTLPDPVLLSGCAIYDIYRGNSTPSVSPLLESIQCYNNYESHVHCQWRRHGNTTLQLWFQTENGRQLCVPHNAAHTAGHRNMHCRYETADLSIGINHTVFFLQNQTLSICSLHQSVDLFQHLKARSPVNLSTHDPGDGGRKLRWSSPYSSPSLNQQLIYQLSYRTHGEDSWTTKDIKHTSVKLEALRPGSSYEARVRARASMGQWSDWSPVVTWQTREDFGKFPPLHCILNGETEVTCSWEVSRELAHFITYQLTCRQNKTASSEPCCGNLTISAGREGLLKYSCSLKITNFQNLQLDLKPTHNAKTFEASKHIRPKPPQQVTVLETGSNWKVEWTEASKPPTLQLYYQVCYYRTEDQVSTVLLNVSQGSLSLTILGTSLVPSQGYQVQVRSLVVPGEGSHYGGIPSKWTDPKKWTSHKATWSLSTLIYILISVCVAAVFLTLYRTIPACQRKVIVWVDSVPSPGKSKILSEIKAVTSQALMQNEKMSICRVQHLDSISTCSSKALLWPKNDTEKNSPVWDEGCWDSDTSALPVEKVNCSDTSSLSFSGPYIFCQSAESHPPSAKVTNKHKENKPPADLSAAPVAFSLFGDGYVCLPQNNVTRCTQDLVSYSTDNANIHTDTPCQHSAQQDQPEMAGQPGLSEPSSGDPPPEYSVGPFFSWPAGNSTEASGYCHLPTAFTKAAE